jgi:magnesium transporter
LHPATAAETLTDEFAVEDVWRILHTTSIANQAHIFAYFPLEWQIKMVEGVGRQEMAKLIERMSHDDRADLLRNLKPQVAEGLLRLVDEADRRDIARLVTYPEGSAGSVMTTDYAWLPVNITVADALERLRLQAPDRETIYVVYIVDDQRRLLGVVSLRDLIMAPRQARLGDVMETKIVTVPVTEDKGKVAQDMARYDLIAMPVVDAENRLVGIITYDDVIDVVVQEATEDVHRMGGVTPLEENYLEARFTHVWRRRAVWLACLFLAELFTFSALAYFEDAIAEIVVLSLFVPLCISTGGNSGSQAATLITRAMALGQVQERDWKRVLRHEVLMGVVLGLTLGLIGFVRASFTPKDVRGSSPPRYDEFVVATHEPLVFHEEHKRAHILFGGQLLQVTVVLPKETHQIITADRPVLIALPEDTPAPEATRNSDGHYVYQFPRKCSLPREPVDRWKLAVVIALAVAAICVWGTLVGSMLPLIFKRFGVDPGIASSPFVATFVDVTGIIIYFSIAHLVLWDRLMGL